MNRFTDRLARVAPLILLFAVGTYALFYSLYLIYIMTVTPDGFDIFLTVVKMLVILGICGSLILAILIRRFDVARRVGSLALVYLIVDLSLNMMIVWQTSLAVTILGFIACFFLILLVTSFVLELFMPVANFVRFLRIGNIFSVGSFALFGFVTVIIYFVDLIRNQAVWGLWMYIFVGLSLLVIIPIGYLLFGVKESDFDIFIVGAQRVKERKEPAREEAVDEPVAEAPVAEEPAAEEPAPEEKADETPQE